jgi:hypothetical protein
MSWQHWIMNEQGTASHYDFLADLTISSYNLKDKSRKEKQKDLLHCFITWWTDNQNKFIKYNKIIDFANSLGLDRTTIIHYQKRRKKSKLYEYNTLCIKDFLNS